MPFTELSNYHTSKWGIVCYTRQFSESHPSDNPWEKERVKCFSICPWIVDTTMTQSPSFDIVKNTAADMVLGLGKMLNSKDVADAFTASLADDVNGSVVAVLPGSCHIKVPNLNTLPLNLTFVLTRILRLGFPYANGLDAGYTVMFLTAALAIFSFSLGYTLASNY